MTYFTQVDTRLQRPLLLLCKPSYSFLDNFTYPTPIMAFTVSSFKKRLQLKFEEVKYHFPFGDKFNNFFY